MIRCNDTGDPKKGITLIKSSFSSPRLFMSKDGKHELSIYKMQCSAEQVCKRNVMFKNSLKKTHFAQNVNLPKKF